MSICKIVAKIVVFFEMVDKFHTLLREKGRSVTKARTLLFEYLQQSGPVSMRQFMDDNTAVADRASLYRTAGMFRELGVIEDRIIQGKRLIELTDLYDAHHHHLTCINCKRTQAVTMEDIEDLLAEMGRRHGFAVRSHIIEVEGLCADCQKP